MLENQKQLFDIPDGMTYLACASYSPLLKSVREAGIGGLDRKFHPWTIRPAELVEESEIARELFANLIGAKADDVAIIPSTAYGVATAAENMTLGKGRKIIILEDQFPSNVYAWRRMAEESEGNVVVVARPGDWDWTSAVLAQLDSDTDIVALPPCHWIDGSRLDLGVIGKRCRELGASFVIDATQAVGAMNIDVDDLQPDYLLCSGYKWLLCPYTISFLYAAPHRHNDRPLEIHGQNRGFGSLPDGHLDYFEGFKTGARRFDMGERNNFINLPMVVSALQQINAWGPENVQDALSPLTELAAVNARKRGWRAPSDDHRVGHYIGITPSFTVTDDTIAQLEAQNIYVTRRGPGLRIAPHLFSDKTDIERVFQVLDRL
jgi:selenocysteine lyase/cysteine desulfurase